MGFWAPGFTYSSHRVHLKSQSGCETSLYFSLSTKRKINYWIKNSILLQNKTIKNHEIHLPLCLDHVVYIINTYKCSEFYVYIKYVCLYVCLYAYIYIYRLSFVKKMVIYWENSDVSFWQCFLSDICSFLVYLYLILWLTIITVCSILNYCYSSWHQIFIVIYAILK